MIFSEEISEILLNKKYQESQESIKNHTPKAKESELKEHIRKRKEFLLRKKAGLPVNNKYDDFKKEFSDEAIYILNMISTQRYLLGEKKGSILESIFDIFKTGCLPCGVKKEKKEIVIFNPIKLKD
ncbi:hypothetical protein [Serratia sp. FGI94]|uniref:hypothetical protein n=1 Tax=Serratia sp. FGI94 TaxID=671990 RepID=UPI00059C5C8F|nr:hypothetical protein [Serratia sp. FGI94]